MKTNYEKTNAHRAYFQSEQMEQWLINDKEAFQLCLNAFIVDISRVETNKPFESMSY